MEEEKREIKEHKDNILNQIMKNEEKKELEIKIDGKMMMIQKAFEEWVAKKKKGKGRGKKKNKKN